jgi:hypothetical protein
MRSRPSLRAYWPLTGLGLSLLLPSTAVVDRYFGLTGVAAYLIGGFLLLFLASAFFYPAIWSFIRDSWVLWLAGLTLVAVLAFITVIYPVANSGHYGGGSDGDEALTISASALLHLEHPYHELTYLGNPISPLPGAVLLSMPFVLLGNVAYQNAFWLAVFFWASGRLLRDRKQALILLWTILLLSLAVVRGLAVGSDYVSNTIYVLVFSLWVIVAYWKPAPRWQQLLPAVLLGIGLSSRANFLLVAPLIFAAVASRAGWKKAFEASITAALGFVAVTIPIFLWDPGAFTPLGTVNEVGKFASVLPAAGLIIPLLAGLVVVILALRDNSSITRFLGHAAISQAVPVLCGMALSSIQAGRITFSFFGFGVFFLFFGALASWPGVWHTAVGEAPAAQISSPTTRATKAP